MSGKPNLRVDPGLVRKLGTYFIRRPANLFARVYGSTQNLVTGGWRQIIFDTERWDTGENAIYTSGFWDGVGGPGELVAVVSGNYLITGHLQFAFHATGIRGIAIYHVRGAVKSYIATHTQQAITIDQTVTIMSIATTHWMRAGDSVQLHGYQSSGGNLNVVEAGNYSPEFTIARLV